MSLGAIQVAPVDRLAPGGGAKAFAVSGISVGSDAEGYVIAIVHPTNVGLSVRLTDKQLDSFAARLAQAVIEKSEADVGLPRIITRVHYSEERKVVGLIRTAAYLGNVHVDDLLGPVRGEPGVVRARFAAIWAARQQTRASYPQLGRTFRRDHSSIVAGERRAVTWRQTDPDFRQLTDALVGDFPANDEGDQA